MMTKLGHRPSVYSITKIRTKHRLFFLAANLKLTRYIKIKVYQIFLKEGGCLLNSELYGLNHMIRRHRSNLGRFAQYTKINNRIKI